LAGGPAGIIVYIAPAVGTPAIGIITIIISEAVEATIHLESGSATIHMI
jgi:hypothetical protein